MPKSKARKNVDENFKVAAVQRLETGGVPANDLAKELGVSIWSLRKWSSQYRKRTAAAAGGAQNGGRDLETTFGRHAGIKCYRTADCRLYISCGDLLIAFPDRQHEPSRGRESLSKMRLVLLSRE